MKWISVKERLPEEEQEVLVYDNLRKALYVSMRIQDGFVLPCLALDDCSYCDHFSNVSENITNWMPIPEQPKENE